MAFPTYKGSMQLLVRKSDDILKGWRPTYNNNEYAKQITCVAMYWLTQNVVETENNYGQFIDLFKKSYYGAIDDLIKQSAYCTVFAWFILDEASKNIGCVHKFPGKKEWGNARNTFNNSKRLYKVNNTPTIGSIMFRNSTDKSVSGHMGIVIDVGKDYIETIEGNVAITEDGSKEGVGAWRYNKKDLSLANGVAFIHVEDESNCRNRNAKSYKGFECNKTTPINKVNNNDCIKLVNGKLLFNDQWPVTVINGKNYMTWRDGNKYEIINCSVDFRNKYIENKKVETTPPKKENTAYEPFSDVTKSVTEKKKICRDVIVKIPSNSQLQHYSKLAEKHVIADILQANNVNKPLRNGSALWYNNTTRLDSGNPTGFGMFKDSIGNTIVILNMNAQSSRDIAVNGFLGYKINPQKVTDRLGATNKNYLAIYLDNRAWKGDGWKERLTESYYSNKFSFQSKNIVQNRVFGVDHGIYLPKDSDINKLLNIYNLQDKTLYGILKEIENRNIKLKTPLVVAIQEREPVPSWTDKLKELIQIANTMTMALGVPIPVNVMRGSEALVNVAEGNYVQAINKVPSIIALAEYFAPETVKGVIEYSKLAETEVHSLISKAGETVKEFMPRLDLNNSILSNAEAVLGLDKNEIKKLFTSYTNSVAGAVPDLTKLISNTVDINEVNKTIYNITNMLMLDRAKYMLDSGTLVNQIKSTPAPLKEIPILQDLIISTGSNATLRMFPNIEKYTEAIINSPIIKNYNKPELLAGVIGQNFGLLPPDKNVMKDIVIDALIGKAQNSNPNTPFVLPATIEEEYIDCYKFVIETESDVKVMHCPDGWKYDTNLRKCVNKTTKVSYSDTNDTKVITSDTTKITGNKYSNDWNSSIKYINTGGTVKVPDIKNETIKTDKNIKKDVKPQPITLPPCITREGDEYYYYPNKARNQKLTYVYETTPNNIYTNQVVRNDFIPNHYVNMSGGLVSIPNNITPTLSDTYKDKYRVYVTNIGTANEMWYVRIDGVVYEFNPYTCQILGYNPQKDVKLDPIKISVPVDSKDSEKLNNKLVEQIKELETKLDLERKARLQKENKPDERVIHLQNELDRIKRDNESKEMLLLSEIKKLSQAKETTPIEIVSELKRQEAKVQELTNIINSQKQTVSPNQTLIKEIELLKKQIDTEKKNQNAIQKSLPAVKKAVEECDDCELAQLPSRVVNITEYGNHRKGNCNNDCYDCDCEDY